MVVYAKEQDIKPAAKLYATEPKTIRKNGLGALMKMAIRLLRIYPYIRIIRSTKNIWRCNLKTIVKLKGKYKRVDAEQIKVLESVKESQPRLGVRYGARTVFLVVNVIKSMSPKQNLREVKKQFALWERVCEDTKDLDDIPEYWPQMMRKRLPKVPYTLREISCVVCNS